MKDNKKHQNHSNEPSIAELAVQLNFKPVYPELFEIAFTHSSYSYESKVPHNERLEFLGDSVLGLIVCQYLYRRFSNYSEGKLAKLKATLVSTAVLAGFAKELQLNRYLRLGQGERQSNGSEKKKVLEDLFEAFLGAYYLNFGLEAANEFMLPLIEECLPEIIRQTETINAKSHLQELTQANGIVPEYRLVKEEGPPHNRTFTVEVLLEQAVYGSGTGKTLKEAQSVAASEAAVKYKQQR
ncbi:MAG TPA: ribonuclease III [Bacillota bacterium]|nr:ribonuclease III [Bacillota bacterium]